MELKLMLRSRNVFSRELGAPPDKAERAFSSINGLSIITALSKETLR